MPSPPASSHHSALPYRLTRLLPSNILSPPSPAALPSPAGLLPTRPRPSLSLTRNRKSGSTTVPGAALGGSRSGDDRVHLLFSSAAPLSLSIAPLLPLSLPRRPLPFLPPRDAVLNELHALWEMKMLHCGAISGNIDRSKAPITSAGGVPGSGTTPPIHDLNVPYEATLEEYATPTTKGTDLGRGPCSGSARAPIGGGSSGRNSTRGRWHRKQLEDNRRHQGHMDKHDG